MISLYFFANIYSQHDLSVLLLKHVQAAWFPRAPCKTCTHIRFRSKINVLLSVSSIFYEYYENEALYLS